MNRHINSTDLTHSSRRKFLAQATTALVLPMASAHALTEQGTPGIASGGAAEFGNGTAGCRPLESLIPSVKDLSREWIASLYARGQPEIYRGSELRFIGMPVSGLTTGQLYLGGDGHLWLWDIFNAAPRMEYGHYAHPLLPRSPILQQFSLEIAGSAGSTERALADGGFEDITFRGEYPIGYVNYRDKSCPLQILLEAFSPFTPLDVDNSSLPATVMKFTLTNVSSERVSGLLTGRLENAVGRTVDACAAVTRINTIERIDSMLLLNCAAKIATSRSIADNGTMGLALLDATFADTGVERATHLNDETTAPVGALTRHFAIDAGESCTVTFVVVWCFPNLTVPGIKSPQGRHYATRFDSARAVAIHLAGNYERLYSQTKLWHDTWYDSSLPYWLLNRTFLNVSSLATSTSMRFSDGRFYGREGVISDAEGTCTHVWHYEQAMGRLFPEFDVLLRERAEFNPAIGFKPDGMIDHRGEFGAGQAVDGQAGTILRCLRDHQLCADGSFLRRNWQAIKKATQWLIAQDGNEDGILEGAQHNTLDAEWYGPVAWLSGLYLAALRAAQEMALDADDHQFADECARIVRRGRKIFVDRLFDGEYFINRPDPQHPEAINSGSGCEIDQVLGQSWAFQVGLGRVLPERETRSALQALWRYNFAPDVGPYRAANKTGRWYAMPGEAGLLMCTFPRKDWDFRKSQGSRGNPLHVAYFNECMNGFEHQVAGHMIWEGMVFEGLAVERAVHDRYHASNRNPWNEVEFGDHYARSMASYGVFIAVCGFEYHGPKGAVAFAPRLTPQNFKCAFTAAEGWGAFTQQSTGGRHTATIAVRWGQLRLRTISLARMSNLDPRSVEVRLGDRRLPASLYKGDKLEIRLGAEIVVQPGADLYLTLL